MVALAVGTPGLGGLIYWRVRQGVIHSPGRGRLILLVAAGPVNLLVWLTAGDWIGRMRHPTTVGIALAVVVFIGLGLRRGGFYWLRRRRPDRHPSERLGEKTEEP